MILVRAVMGRRFQLSFSPLFIGSRIVTSHPEVISLAGFGDFQSPFHRVKDCNTG